VYVKITVHMMEINNNSNNRNNSDSSDSSHRDLLQKKQHGRPLAPENPRAYVVQLRQSFIYFSVVLSINHALAYVVNSYASSVLSKDLSSMILGLSWTVNAFSGLLIATPIVIHLGWKYSVILALLGYTIQIVAIFISLVYPAYAWPVSITGCLISGITSAVWWTAQGVYFERTCSLIEETVQDPLLLSKSDDMSAFSSATSDLTVYWMVIYQVADIVVFLSLSVFPLYGGISFNTMICVLCVVGYITTVLGFTLDPLGITEMAISRGSSRCSETVMSVPMLFKNDARAALLAPFVFGFGVTTAMFTYYLNDSAVTEQIGTQYIGLVEGYSYFIATASAFPYAYICRNYRNGMHIVMQLGSLAFLLTGLLVMLFTSAELSTWKLIFIVRGLYGLGRGVFEGTCRAAYATYFKNGDSLAAAFSSQTLLAGLSGGLAYFIFSGLDRKTIGTITVINGVAALTGYQLLVMHPGSASRLSWSSLLFDTKTTDSEYVTLA
jgi:hypothetical protein